MQECEKFALEFLQDSSLAPDVAWDDEYERGERFKAYPDAQKIALPEIQDESGMGLWEAMAARRSVRQYSDQPLTLEQLARVLWAAQGVTATRGEFLLRTAPSAGGLFPYETYVLVKNVEGLEPGTYHLNISDWTLEFIKPGDSSSKLMEAALGQKFVGQVPVVIATTILCDRFLWRYKKRGVRYAFIDIGHVGQNIALAAAAMQMGCCAVGAYFDQSVADVIGHGRKDELPVYLNAVGFPAK